MSEVRLKLYFPPPGQGKRPQMGQALATAGLSADVVSTIQAYLGSAPRRACHPGPALGAVAIQWINPRDGVPSESFPVSVDMQPPGDGDWFLLGLP